MKLFLLIFNNILFIQIALNFADKGHTVVYLRTKPFAKISQLAYYKQRFPSAIYTKFLFFYMQTFEELITYILTIHKWNLTPTLIIIESLDSFPMKRTENLTTSLTYINFLKNYSLLIAALQNIVRNYGVNNNSTCFSAITLNSQSFPSNCSTVMQRLIDLYYYKNNHFNGTGILASKLIEGYLNV